MTSKMAELAFMDLSQELDATRAMLARLPEDRLAWAPHEKSMKLGELGGHCANVLTWGVTTVNEDGHDMAAGAAPPKPPASVAELLERFDGNRAEMEAALAGADDETLKGGWTLSHGDHAIFTLPKLEVFRRFVISHMIHHRAQLGVYLRLLDQSVPAVYGPSADER